MRILQVVHQYPPSRVGGTELHTQMVSRGMARLGHGVAVFHREDGSGVGSDCRDDDGIRVWRAWSGTPTAGQRALSTLRDPPIQRSFERVLDQEQPDVVHVQHLIGLPSTVIGSIQQRGIPFVITLHDYWWVCINAQLLTNYDQKLCAGPRAHINCARCALARAGTSLLWPAIPSLAALLAWRGEQLRRALLRARKLIAPSTFVRNWYAAHGIPGQGIEVMPHGVQGREDARLPRRKGAAVLFAYIGGLAWQKGVHVLLDAFSGVAGLSELWVAGDESIDPVYVARLRSKAPQNVRFLGALARERVWDVLSQVDALVVPSLWHETFSLIVHEAFAAGVPVLASAVGALNEAVRDGVNGLLVPRGDVTAWRLALQRLVEAPERIERLRANVRPPPSFEEYVHRLESLYRDGLRTTGVN